MTITQIATNSIDTELKKRIDLMFVIHGMGQQSESFTANVTSLRNNCEELLRTKFLPEETFSEEM
jgi:hypothetical protein